MFHGFHTFPLTLQHSVGKHCRSSCVGFAKSHALLLNRISGWTPLRPKLLEEIPQYPKLPGLRVPLKQWTCCHISTSSPLSISLSLSTAQCHSSQHPWAPAARRRRPRGTRQRLVRQRGACPAPNRPGEAKGPHGLCHSPVSKQLIFFEDIVYGYTWDMNMSQTCKLEKKGRRKETPFESRIERYFYRYPPTGWRF